MMGTYQSVSEVRIGDIIECPEKRKAVVVEVRSGLVYHKHKDSGSIGKCPYNKCILISSNNISINKSRDKKGGNKMWHSVQSYVEEHKDMLMTVAVVVVLDHFLFGGAMRQRIQGVAEGLLKKVENAVSPKQTQS